MITIPFQHRTFCDEETSPKQNLQRLDVWSPLSLAARIFAVDLTIGDIDMFCLPPYDDFDTLLA